MTTDSEAVALLDTALCMLDRVEGDVSALTAGMIDIGLATDWQSAAAERYLTSLDEAASRLGVLRREVGEAVTSVRDERARRVIGS